MAARVGTVVRWVACLGVLVTCFAAPQDSGGAAPGTSLMATSPTTVGMPVGPDGVTYGYTVLTLAAGAAPITLEDVRIGGDAIQVVGVNVLGPDRRLYSFTNDPGFPSESGIGSRPAIGTVIRPAPRGYDLLFGLVGSGADVLVSEGIDVTYSVNGFRFRQHFPTTLVLCPPETLSRSGQCLPPGQLTLS